MALGGLSWGWPLYLHPPLAPPIKGGGFRRMAFIPALKSGAFWHDMVKPIILCGE
jgi:hypothetical protein